MALNFINDERPTSNIERPTSNKKQLLTDEDLFGRPDFDEIVEPGRCLSAANSG